VHFIDDWGFDDRRYLAGYHRWDTDALYARYFATVADSADTGLFDTIGHTDLVKKFGHRARTDQSANYRCLAERFARAGVCVEVNTGGLRKPVGEAYPHPDLLRACQQAGVPVTFGSDAHAPAEVAADLARAADVMRTAGYEQFVTFDRRRRTPLSLTEGEGGEQVEKSSTST
jgi:histidinol-phosphatase (PHP family)